MSSAGMGSPHGPIALSLSLVRRVWRDASWSLVGNLLTLFSGLAILKLIGLLVDRQQYGSASLVLGVAGLLTQLISNPLLTERTRLYFDQMRNGGAVAIFQAVQTRLLTTSALACVVYLAFAGVTYQQGNRIYLQLTVPVICLLVVFPQLTAVLSQLEALRAYRALAIAQPMVTVLQVPFLALLLWMSLQGASAIVWGQAFAGLVVYAFFRVRLARSAGPAAAGTDTSSPAITALGWSLYASNVASWLMTNGDRYLVDHFLSRAEVGIYVINYAFFSIPYTVVNGWINSVSRPRIYQRAAEQQWDRVLRVSLGSLGTGLLFGVLGAGIIYVIGRPLALLIMGERYWHSEQLMMLIVVAHIFFIMGHTSTIYYLALKNSTVVWQSCVAMAIVNVALNVVLLPRLGLIAAAWATLATYVLWSVVLITGILVLSRRMK